MTDDCIRGTLKVIFFDDQQLLSLPCSIGYLAFAKSLQVYLINILFISKYLSNILFLSYPHIHSYLHIPLHMYELLCNDCPICTRFP